MSSQLTIPVKKENHLTANLKQKTQGILIGCLSISFILLQLLNGPTVENSISFVILVAIVWILPSMRGMPLYITSFLLTAGLFLMLYHQAPSIEWISSVRINLPLVAIFIVVPLLGIPVRTGGYVDALKIVLANNMNKPYFFYMGTNLLTHLLSIVINIGSISIASELTKASDIKNPKLIANAINRGYIMTVYYSPYFSSMALVLAFLPIKWSSIVLYSLGLVVISIIVSFLLDRKEIKESAWLEADKEPLFIEKKEVVKAKKKVLELAIYLVLITVAVLFFESITSASMVLMVSLVSLLFPFLWCLIFRKGNVYREEFKRHVFVGLPRMKNEIVLFLVAGFFSGAFIYADLGQSLMSIMQNTFGSFYIGSAFFISITIFLAALIGIHPIVIITVFVTSITPELIGLSPEYFAILLLVSFGVSNTISPSTAVNNLLANLLNVGLVDVSLRWNFKFAIIMMLIIPTYLTILGV